MRIRHIMVVLAAVVLAAIGEAVGVPTVIRWHGEGIQI
jgi:hypothetical protein